MAKIKIKKEPEVIFKRFNNMTEYHTYLQNGVVQPAFKGKESSRNASEYFTGTANYESADKLFMYGDEDNAKKINEESNIRMMIHKYAATKPATKKYVSVVGALPHIPNYIAGVPTNMIAVKRVKVRERVMNVHFNMAIPCGVETKDIITTTVELFKAIMMLESNGTRVNLYTGVAVSSSSGDQVVGSSIKIKSATQPIDIVKMVYPLVNPSMLRRHNFRFIEITEGVKDEFVYSYGYVKEIADKYIKKELKGTHFVSFRQIRNMTCKSIVQEILDN